jgi:Raf kinase inhibitor-like YbhB/YbcL family protein
MYKYLGIIMCSALAAEKLELTSPVFKQGEAIDKVYTCEGKNKAPALAWTGAPEGTKSFALIIDDPDAPSEEPWVHWIVFNIPAGKAGLSKSLQRREMLADGTKQGVNSSSHIGYDGPCPPPGKAHRYFFKLYALDTLLTLKAGVTKKQLEIAMKKHILAQAELMGTYKR